MSEPLLERHNIYASNKKPFAYQADSYKAHDPTTGKILNCYYPQKGPMEIALNGGYTQSNNLTETQYQNKARGACVLSKYPIATYPELYDSFKKEYVIFKKLYINNISGSLNSANLVPSYSGNTVSCSSSGNNYIPYVLEYELNREYKRYANFCATPEQINQLQFTTIGDHQVFQYIDANTDSNCQTSVCTTKYPSFVGHNLSSTPIISSKPEENNRHTILIIVFVVAGILLFGLIIFSIIHLRERKYKKNKLNKKQPVTTNPTFSKKST